MVIDACEIGKGNATPTPKPTATPASSQGSSDTTDSAVTQKPAPVTPANAQTSESSGMSTGLIAAIVAASAIIVIIVVVVVVVSKSKKKKSQ